MIDPITLSAAVSGATAAYNGIKKAIMMGREIEDLGSQLSTWMSAVSDVDNIHKNHLSHLLIVQHHPQHHNQNLSKALHNQLSHT